MKRLLLVVLFACPFACADNNAEIKQAWEKLNSYRLFSGAKCVLQVATASFAVSHGYENGKLFLDNLPEVFDNKRQRDATLKHGVISFGMIYTALDLYLRAWKNAKHALAIK